MSKSNNVDVLVIGAGPAGAVAAAMIQKHGFHVRVVEREKFPRFVIGESLLPRCMEALEAAELLEAVKACGFQEKFGAKFIRNDEVADFNFEDQFTTGWSWTWQVTRKEFDLALINEVQRKGVKVDFETTVNDIEFHEDESSITTITRNDGSVEKIGARFIVDASGYGRVVPRLLKLDKPSTLEPRQAFFAHLQDHNRAEDDDPNRIIIASCAPRVWAWAIPFATGVTSVGFVGDTEYFDSLGDDNASKFAGCIDSDAYFKKRFEDSVQVFEPRTLASWSTASTHYHGEGFVLTGNVTEFLDPIFSSGVMFATVSSHRASVLVIEKLKGATVNWETDYTKFIQQGVHTFRAFVNAWYEGTLEKIFYSENQDLTMKRQICSVLAGYVWDMENPFVRAPEKALKSLAKVIELNRFK